MPEELKKLIVKMAIANVNWGEERIARELLVKLGIRVSPRTVRKYMPNRDHGGRGAHHSSQRWATFVRNHAKAIIAADFLTVVTARFQFLYVFVVMEVGTRKIVHVNVTTHPTAEWTLQQFRETIPCEHDYRFVIVDRDTKFSEDLRKSVRAMRVRVLRTPAFAPQVNGYCERLIGTTRRECLDFLIPLSENHLRRVLAEWRDYYNQARPHSSLGPMSLSRRAIFPSILLRRGTLFQLDSASFPCRFSARSITIIGWHALPDRAKPSDAGLPPSWRRLLSRPLSTVSTPRKLRELDTCVLTVFVGAAPSANSVAGSTSRLCFFAVHNGGVRCVVR